MGSVGIARGSYHSTLYRKFLRWPQQVVRFRVQNHLRACSLELADLIDQRAFIVPPLFRVNILRMTNFVCIESTAGNFTKFYNLVPMNFILFDIIRFLIQLLISGVIHGFSQV